MKRDWKRKIIGGLCLTSVAFVFQACYGTPQDFGNDLLIEGVRHNKKNDDQDEHKLIHYFSLET